MADSQIHPILGNRLQVFQATTGARIVDFIGTVLFLIFFGGLLFWLTLFVFLNYRFPAKLLSLIPAALIVGMAYAIVRSMARPCSSIELFEHGFIQKDGCIEHVAAWNDITAVHWHASQDGAATLRRHVAATDVATSADKFCLMAGIAGTYIHGPVEQRLFVETFERMLPNFTSDIEAGSSVSFGDLSLSRDGIHRGSEVLHWSDLADVTFDDRPNREHGIGSTFQIDKKGERAWCNGVIVQVPNWHLFLALVERYGACPGLRDRYFADLHSGR